MGWTIDLLFCVSLTLGISIYESTLVEPSIFFLHCVVYFYLKNFKRNDQDLVVGHLLLQDLQTFWQVFLVASLYFCL